MGKKVVVDATLVKAHISAYTKKDGTFVAAHHDKRPSAKTPVASSSVPANAVPTKKSFVVQKVGKKWLTVTHPGKTFQMQLAITPQTAHLKAGDTVNNMHVGEVKDSSKFGVKITYYPLSAEAAAEANKKAVAAEIGKWLGWVEEKAHHEGYLHENGLSKLKELGALSDPEVAARVAAAKNAVKKANLSKWTGFVMQAASEGYIYHKGVDKMKELGATPEQIAQATAAVAKVQQAKAEAAAAAKKKQDEEDAAKGIKKYYAWGGKDGYGIPSVGSVIKRNGEYVKVHSVSKGRYFGEDASSFGGSDDARWQYRVSTVPASEEESAALKKHEAVAALKASGAKQIASLAQKISKEGQKPEKANPEGDVVYNTFNAYGGGERFVIGKDAIWYIRNNGMDGDTWSVNNVTTGGAGAIGFSMPYSFDLEHQIRQAAANAEGKEYTVPEKPADKPKKGHSYRLFKDSGNSDPWTDEQWAKLAMDGDGKNAATHNRQLERIRGMAKLGDVNGLLAMKHGINTYGKRRAKIVQHLLTAMGHGVFTKSFVNGSIILRKRAGLLRGADRMHIKSNRRSPLVRAKEFAL